MNNHIVIMAGGVGKRLWPASDRETPKQFLSLRGNKSLITETLERASALSRNGYIIIVTNAAHAAQAAENCRTFSPPLKKKIVILSEPEGKNTAPALFLAAVWLSLQKQKDSSFLVLPADHLIEPLEKFRSAAETAFQIASDGFLVPFGISPGYPETGYGYIEAGEKTGLGRTIISFKEKPDPETAEKFLSAGNFYWNSGMFVFPTGLFLSEMENCSPEVVKPFKGLKKTAFRSRKKYGINIFTAGSSLEKIYSSVPSISVDYALMEKSGKRKMAEADFSWNDVGSWDAVADLEFGSTETLEENSRNNYVLSDIPVALCGVDNLIVIIKKGKALVCRRGASQLVKTIADKDTK